MATSLPKRLGYPPVVDPRAFDLRAFQGTVQNIRGQLEALNAVAAGLQNQSNANTAAQAVALIQQQIQSLTQRLTAVEAAVGITETVSLPAIGAALVVGDVVVPAGSGCKRADPDDVSVAFSAIGIVTKGGDVGQAVTVQRRGSLTIPSSSSFDVGFAVYAAVGGGVTQDPSGHLVAIPIGVATASNTLWVAPGPLAMLEVTGAAAEGPVPASVMLVQEALDFITQLNAAPPGLLVKTSGGVVSRTLQSNAGIVIENPDGDNGDPIIQLVPEGTALPQAGTARITGEQPAVVVA